MSATREARPRLRGARPPAGIGKLARVGILMVGIPLGLGALVAILLMREGPGEALTWSLVAAAVAFVAGTLGSLYMALGCAVEMINEIEIETRSAGARARAAAEEERQMASTRSPGARQQKAESARDKSEAR